jgi:hypothetical protein
VLVGRIEEIVVGLMLSFGFLLVGEKIIHNTFTIATSFILFTLVVTLVVAFGFFILFLFDHNIFADYNQYNQIRKFG